MSGLKANLRLAKEALAQEDHKGALQYCKAALKADKASYEAYMYAARPITVNWTMTSLPLTNSRQPGGCNEALERNFRLPTRKFRLYKRTVAQELHLFPQNMH